MEKTSQKMLFIHPSFFFQEKYHKDLFYKNFPIQALQLSALLKKDNKIKTKFLDLRFEKEISKYFSKSELDKISFENALISVLERFEVQDIKNIAIISTSSFQFLQTKLIIENIKKGFPNTNIIVAGHHPTAAIHDFTNLTPKVDIIIKGEPEEPFREIFQSSLLSKLHSRKRPLIIKSNNACNLNKLPIPDYESYLKRYKDKTSFNFTINASRGCPFRCRFCKIPKVKFRNFSYSKFIERFNKLQSLVLKYNSHPPKIRFLDQSFNSLRISTKILNYIIENKLQEQFRFSCQTRLEIVSNHILLLNLFKKANMVVGYGFESANKALLSEMNKTKNPAVYIDKMKKVLDFYKKISDPYCRINIIAGFPGENQKTLQETIAFLEKNAFHSNIQINPTIYINDPITYIYKNMDYYTKKYGSAFLWEWWKLSSDPLKNAVPLRSSHDYTRSQLLSDYLDGYKSLLNRFKYTDLTSLINWKRYYGHWTQKLTGKE